MRDERQPNSSHLFLGIIACIIVFLLMVLDYPDVFVGVTVIFSVTLTFGLYWAEIMYLEEPHNTVWARARIPPHLLEVDVDEYLGLEVYDEHADDVSVGAAGIFSGVPGWESMGSE